MNSLKLNVTVHEFFVHLHLYTVLVLLLFTDKIIINEIQLEWPLEGIRQFRSFSLPSTYKKLTKAATTVTCHFMAI